MLSVQMLFPSTAINYNTSMLTLMLCNHIKVSRQFGRDKHAIRQDREGDAHSNAVLRGYRMEIVRSRLPQESYPYY